MYRNLIWIARTRYGLSPDEASDVASFAYCKALEYCKLDLSYAAACLTNEILLRRKRRKRETQFTYRREDEESGEPIEARKSFVRPNQFEAMEVHECISAIKNLPEPLSEVMKMTAIGCDAGEISASLGMKLSTTERAVTAGRKMLKEKDIHDLPQKSGHQKFIGIKKSGRKWKAYINRDGVRHYVGSYPSASLAAIAYDKAAKRLLGEKAKLNFRDKGATENG